MPKRYFKNVYTDKHENVLNTSFEYWRDRVNSLVKCIEKNVSSMSKNTLYTGTAGVAYMFYCLAISDKFNDNSTAFLNKAIKVLKLNEYPQDPKKLRQFLCGDAGINAINAAIYHLIDDKKMSKMYLERFESGLTDCRSIGSLKPGEDELFNGRAGYLFGALWLEKVFGTKILPDQDIIELCSIIVESGRNYSRKNQCLFPLMYAYHNKEYLGAAHGLCTILQALISCPKFIEKESQDRQDIKKCIDLLISFQTMNGNFPTRILEPGSKQRLEEDELIHWCHGAPGVIYLIAKAYLVFKENSYLECCLKCGDLIWTKGLLKKGPGICHGIAGNGYVFLLLYRLTGDTKHLNRAIQFGEFLFTDKCHQGSRKPDNPYSLFEGFAGAVCYLIDLTQPEKASFPFLDVF